MSDNLDLSLLELVTIHTALDNYIFKLEKLAADDDDIMLRGEISTSKEAQQKIKEYYLSKNGSSDYL
ncbi:MAG: hypothetical protein LUD81_07940 [Clostridiales bacterium]|nr:hypothetical protein [Clostridiales bacterium]